MSLSKQGYNNSCFIKNYDRKTVFFTDCVMCTWIHQHHIALKYHIDKESFVFRMKDFIEFLYLVVFDLFFASFTSPQYNSLLQWVASNVL